MPGNSWTPESKEYVNPILQSEKSARANPAVREVRAAVTSGEHLLGVGDKGAPRALSIFRRRSCWPECGHSSVFIWKNALSWTRQFVSSTACTSYLNKRANKKKMKGNWDKEKSNATIKTTQAPAGVATVPDPRTPPPPRETSPQPCKGGCDRFAETEAAASEGFEFHTILSSVCLRIRSSPARCSLGIQAWQTLLHPFYRRKNEGPDTCPR